MNAIAAPVYTSVSYPASSTENHYDIFGLKGNVLCFDYLEKAAQGDEEFKQEVLLHFIRQVPANMEKMEKAIPQNDSNIANTRVLRMNIKRRCISYVDV